MTTDNRRILCSLNDDSNDHPRAEQWHCAEFATVILIDPRGASGATRLPACRKHEDTLDAVPGASFENITEADLVRWGLTMEPEVSDVPEAVVDDSPCLCGAYDHAAMECLGPDYTPAPLVPGTGDYNGLPARMVRPGDSVIFALKTNQGQGYEGRVLTVEPTLGGERARIRAIMTTDGTIAEGEAGEVWTPSDASPEWDLSFMRTAARERFTNLLNTDDYEDEEHFLGILADLGSKTYKALTPGGPLRPLDGPHRRGLRPQPRQGLRARGGRWRGGRVTYRVVHRARYGDRVMKVAATLTNEDAARSVAILDNAYLRLRRSRCWARAEVLVDGRWVPLLDKPAPTP